MPLKLVNIGSILITSLILMFFTKCEQFEIPPQLVEAREDIRMYEIRQINEPSILLKKVYKRQVFKIHDIVENETTIRVVEDFQVCKQSPPEISFKNIGYYMLDQSVSPYAGTQEETNQTGVTNKNIIYDYEVLKQKHQNIIDMAYYKGSIFTISSDAILSVFGLTNQQNGIVPKSYLKAVDWDQLYKHRYLQWQRYQNKEKQRQDLVQKQKNQSQNQIDTNKSEPVNQNQPQGSKNNDINPSPTDDSNTQPTRLLQAVPPSLKVYQQQNSQAQPSQQKYYTGPPPTKPKPYLQKGYFEIMDKNKLLIFANNQYLIGYDLKINLCFLLSQQPKYDILIERNKTKDNQKASQDPSLIPESEKPQQREFIKMENFEQITKINETHFAVIDKNKGIYIYEIRKQKIQNVTSFSKNPSSYFLKKVAFLGKQQFGNLFQQDQELNLNDIVFYKNKSLLLVLDYEKGVIAFQQQKMNQQNKNPNEVQNLGAFLLSPYRIIKKMCDLMQFSQKSYEIYLSCNKIYRISVKNWPKITQKIYPHPLINIRQIYIEEQKNIVILSGYSVFKVMYLDRAANYFQDEMLDKIIFNSDTVITANENHIIALKYKVEKPTIICQAQNRTSLGMHNILLRTTAQCSKQYLKSINYTVNENNTFENDNVCVYNIYKSVYIWEQGEVPLKPLAIVMLIFLIFILVMLIWFILIKFRMQRAQRHLKYLAEEGHKTLVEEEEPQKSVSQVKQLQKDEIQTDQPNRQSSISINTNEQEDHNKDLYAIE